MGTMHSRTSGRDGFDIEKPPGDVAQREAHTDAEADAARKAQPAAAAPSGGAAEQQAAENPSAQATDATKPQE